MNDYLVKLDEVAAAPAAEAPTVLTGVRLTLRAGECLALVGPSGAGKTTLLRTIAGQVRTRAGSLLVEGADPAAAGRDRRRRARIGTITQRQDLVDSLKVHTNVMAGALGRWSTARALRYLLWPRAEELAEAEASLAAVGLAQKLNERTSALSGGEQQRVAIARALVRRRSYCSPTNRSLRSTATAEQVLELLTGLARSRGMGVICSLHEIGMAEKFCDRVLHVRGGTVHERIA